jgi:hypothetical protein
MIVSVALNRDSEKAKITKIIITYIILRSEYHDYRKNTVYILINIGAEENFVSQRWIAERGLYTSNEIRNTYIINNYTIIIYGKYQIKIRITNLKKRNSKININFFNY